MAKQKEILEHLSELYQKNGIVSAVYLQRKFKVSFKIASHYIQNLYQLHGGVVCPLYRCLYQDGYATPIPFPYIPYMFENLYLYDSVNKCIIENFKPNKNQS